MSDRLRLRYEYPRTWYETEHGTEYVRADLLTAAVARIAELECRLRCRAARGKTDAWDSTGQPAPTQSDPDGYQKG